MSDQSRKIEDQHHVKKIHSKVQSRNACNKDRAPIKKGNNGSGASASVMLGVFYSSGALWVHLGGARNLGVSGGKVYAKTYLISDIVTSKQKTALVDGTQEPQFKATMTVSELMVIRTIFTLCSWA